MVRGTWCGGAVGRVVVRCGAVGRGAAVLRDVVVARCGAVGARLACMILVSLVLAPISSSETPRARYSPSESQRRWFSFWNCCTCLGAEPPAPVSKRPPPARRGTIESILA